MEPLSRLSLNWWLLLLWQGGEPRVPVRRKDVASVGAVPVVPLALHVEGDIQYRCLLLPSGLRESLPGVWDRLSMRVSMGCVQTEAKLGKERNQCIHLHF